MNVYYTRHGQSSNKVTGIASDANTVLTSKGRQQAKSAGRKIARSLQVDLILASPLSRTRETAEIIAQELGYPLERIEYSDLLVERSFDVISGKKTSLSEYMKENKLSYKDLDTIKSIESLESVYTRAASVLELINNKSEETILIVGHGIFGRALRRTVAGKDFAGEYLSDYDYAADYISNSDIFNLI